jgi:hypothetical protein
VAFVIVQLVGTVFSPLVIVESQVAEGFFTNVPVDATPFTQLDVYVKDGVVVNIALI